MIPADDDRDVYYAMKIIKRNKISSSMAELEALKKLDHPNIIKLYEIIDDPADPNMYLVMDQIEGGTIEDQILKTQGSLNDARM